jgi:hypothetical protein
MEKEVRPVDIVPVMFGGAILLFGRVLYWLFVGVVAYFLGFQLATNFLPGEPGLITLIAIIAGIIGIALAVVARYMAVGLTGFIVGGFLFNQVTVAFDFSAGDYAWLIFVAGGVFGVMLVGFLSDWALILLSAFAGALLVLNELPVQESLIFWVYLGLVLLGIIVQGVFLWTRNPEKKELPG